MLKEFSTLVLKYESFIKAHAVAMKINVSWTIGPITLSIALVGDMASAQYGVFPIGMPFTIIDAAIELARKASQNRPKKATAYLLFV